MRIALVTPRFLPEYGGIQLHVKELAAHLAAAGDEVAILTTCARSERKKPLRVPELDGRVTIRRFPAFLHASEILPSLRLSRWISKHRDEFDAIHVHNYHSLTSALAIFAAGKVPVILTPHYHGGGTAWARRLFHRIYQPLGRRVLSAATLIVVVSKAESDLLNVDFPTVGVRRTLIPNGVRQAVTGTRTAEHGLVLSVGRLQGYKRVDLIIRAVAELPPGLRLAIVGDGPHRRALVRLTQALGLRHRVSFLGHVSDERLAELLTSASVFVSLSTREAYGLTLAEALANGLPAVASDIAAHREVGANFPTTCHFVAAPREQPGRRGSEAALLETIRRSLSQALARPPVQTRSPLPQWDETTCATRALYRQVLEGRALARN